MELTAGYRAVVCLALLACLGGAQDELFRSDVNLVNVAFAVRDAKGGLVGALTADRFQITEDGVPQKISFFAKSSDLPLTLGILVDASGSQEEFMKKHRRDLSDFLKTTVSTRDKVFLLCFGNQLRLAADLTPNPAAILKGFSDFEDRDRDFPTLGPRERRLLGTAFYDAIFYSVKQRLSDDTPGRKALVIFSDGEDNSSAHHMLDAIEAAQEHNVTLFCVRYTKADKGELNARNKYGIGVMERISAETGGIHLDATRGKLSQSFAQISEQLRSSYEIAYHSTHPRDGSFRKIKITVKEPNLMVRSATGYFARP